MQDQPVKKECLQTERGMAFNELVEGILELIPDIKPKYEKAKAQEPSEAPPYKGVKHPYDVLGKVNDVEGKSHRTSRHCSTGVHIIDSALQGLVLIELAVVRLERRSHPCEQYDVTLKKVGPCRAQGGNASQILSAVRVQGHKTSTDLLVTPAQ